MNYTEDELQKIELRKKDIRRMLKSMIDAGIRQEEMSRAIGCSRWMLTLWLKKQHAPSDESYEAIKKAHAKFQPERLPKPGRMVKLLSQHGIDLLDKIKCSQTSLEAWTTGRHQPQARYRSKLVDLYRRHVEAA